MSSTSTHLETNFELAKLAIAVLSPTEYQILRSMASRVELDVLTEHGLTRNELNIPCPAKVCNTIAMKLDRWELLASFLGLAEEDCTAIREDYNTNYAKQRSVSLNTWKQQFGSKATYLMLAEGLEKIKRLDLVGELCVLYKDTVASQDTDNRTALTIGPKGTNHL